MSVSQNIFDKLRKHSRYVEKTLQKINTDLVNLNLDNASEENIDCILNLDCSIENEIDDLLAQIRETNNELEVLKEETEESVSVLTKQLEYIEEYFNMNPSEIDDSNGNFEKAECLVQIIADEPEDEVNNVQGEQTEQTKVDVQPVNDATTSLLSILETKQRAELITPPKVIYSKIVERILAKRRNCENEIDE